MSIIGRIVALPNNQGFAKLSSVEGEDASIEIFYSVARQERISCKIKDLSWGFLAKQTRVYRKKDAGYDVGRVVDFLDEQEQGVIYTVKFPNSRQLDIREQDLYVRPWSSPENPVEIFALNGGESQYLYDRRQPFVKRVRQLKNASLGLDAIISSNVELVEHQIEAIQRVLSDPVQRFLLADEVGLGKTVEAGLIIKQHLIDNANIEVLIVVPNHLVRQWNSELTNKIGLSEYVSQITILPHENLGTIERDFDVVVVDEVHNIIQSSDEYAYDNLKKICEFPEVLLLLTATPPTGRNQVFFKLLQVLDPELYPDESYEEFQRKIELRSQVGQLLLALSPGTSIRILRRGAQSLINQFPNDQTVNTLANELILACENDTNVGPAVEKLRTTVAEKYRLDQRIIRSRRIDAQGWEFQSRGPKGDPNSSSHIICENLSSTEYTDLYYLIEEWRLAASNYLEHHIECTDVIMNKLKRILTGASLDGHELSAIIDDLSISFEGERQLLLDIQAQAKTCDVYVKDSVVIASIERLIKTLNSEVKAPAIVLCAGSASIAKRMVLTLRTKFIDYEIITPDQTPAGSHLNDIIAKVASCVIVVLDPLQEEGINLAEADAIVHYDLQFDVLKLEQRIGRVDRFGRKKGEIRHRYFFPTDLDDTAWDIWFAALLNAFQIFHHSVSDIHLMANELTDDLFTTILHNGALNHEEKIHEIKSKVEVVRKEQDDQHALDKLSKDARDRSSIGRDIEEEEEYEDDIQTDCERWFFSTLLLYKKYFPGKSREIFGVDQSDRTLIPYSPWLLRISEQTEKALTWKRTRATIENAVQLFRPGFALFDELDRFTNWDDRGRVFATYKCIRGWAIEPQIYFKLDLVLKPNFIVKNLLNVSLKERAIQRKTLKYFKPQNFSLFLDVSGNEVTDPVWVEYLSRPYDKRIDTNLSSRPEMFDGFLNLHSLGIVGKSMQSIAAKKIFEREDVLLSQKVALEKVHNDQNFIDTISEDRTGKFSVREDNKSTLKIIQRSLEDLVIELEAFGCIVVGGER